MNFSSELFHFLTVLHPHLQVSKISLEILSTCEDVVFHNRILRRENSPDANWVIPQF